MGQIPRSAERITCEGVSNTITQLRFLGCVFLHFTLGIMAKKCFATNLRHFWRYENQIFRGYRPPSELSKNIKFGGGGPPNFGKFRLKCQILNVLAHISDIPRDRKTKISGIIGLLGTFQKYKIWG